MEILKTIRQKTKTTLTLIIVLLFVVQYANAQNAKPKLFINCLTECYENYLKTELNYFDFVRDRFEADIQILIIEQEQANGGTQYTLQFKGAKEWQKYNDTLQINFKQAATNDDIRVKLVQSISIYLLRVIPLKSIPDDVVVEFPIREANQIDSVKDKWNFWVIAPTLYGWANGGTNNMNTSFGSEIAFRRVTNKSKFIARPYYNHSSSFIRIDSVTAKAQTMDYGFNVLYAKSLTQHWSTGGIFQYNHNYFLNINRSIKTAPVIEYNIFPFSINTSKQIRIAYQAGFNVFNYIDTTVFNVLQETRPYHRITLNMEYNRPWGSISTGLYHNAYLDKYAQNRTGIDVSFSVRLFEGFSLYFDGGGSYINDQISLLKNSLSDEAYYLGSQQLPADFNYRMSFGITYTFGSIYNSIVNPRCDDID